MAVEETDGAIVFTGPDIPVFQIIATRGALKLEMHGLRQRAGTVMIPIANWGIVEPKSRYMKNDKLIALARLDRIIARLKENRANGIEQDVKVVIATVLVEMAEEKLAKAEKKVTEANNKVVELEKGLNDGDN